MIPATVPEEIRNSREKKAAIRYSGFVAQEVEEAAELSNYVFSGVDKPEREEGLYGLRYAEFVVPLVKAVQELAVENDQLVQEMDARQEIIDRQETRITELEANLKLISQLEARLVKLEAGQVE